MTYWLDHAGRLLGPGQADPPTGWDDLRRHTCRIIRPQPGQLIQAIGWCGRRVGEVPGRGPVDCPDCLQLLGEERQLTPEGLP